MNYCGIDLAGVSSYAYVGDEHGGKLWAGPLATEKTAFQRLVQRFEQGGLSIAIEAGNQTTWVYDELVKLGARVTVVNPRKVKLIAESRRKTDKIDAQLLCELLRLNGLPHPVHMPGPEARQRRSLLASRRQLIRTRVRLCHVVRGQLRQTGVRLAAGELKSRVSWERVLAAGFQHDHLLHIVPAYYESFRAVTHSIRDLDQQLAQHEKNDPRVARLRTMPKVGRIAALTFLAAVDDVHRFPSSRKLVGYAGLAPTVRQSGPRAQYGAISREGCGELRAVWVQIAHLVARDTGKNTQPLRAWFRRLTKKRGQKTALVALARRLLVIAYQLLKQETNYDPSRLQKKRRAA